jgi:cytochrome b561
MTATLTPEDVDVIGQVRPSYSAVAIALHWLIALLIFTNIGLAWYFDKLPRSAQIEPQQWHKAIGLTVLALSLARLAWRFIRPPPPLPKTLSTLELWAARAVYLLFYVIMIGMPLSGWAMISASKYLHAAFSKVPILGVPFPGIGPIEHLDPVVKDQAAHLFSFTHEKLAWLAYALILLHVAAALRHHFLLKDEVVPSMAPIFKRPRKAA